MSNLQNLIISFTNKDDFNSNCGGSEHVGAHYFSRISKEFIFLVHDRSKAFVNFIKMKAYKEKYCQSQL